MVTSLVPLLLREKVAKGQMRELPHTSEYCNDYFNRDHKARIAGAASHSLLDPAYAFPPLKPVTAHG